MDGGQLKGRMWMLPVPSWLAHGSISQLYAESPQTAMNSQVTN